MNSVAENYAKILRHIDAAAKGRPIRLVAVSKTFPAEKVREGFEAGIRIFGENRVQEAVSKIESTRDLSVEWHFIGHLQTNKVREAVRHFSWIQSIDSIKLLLQVEKEAEKQQKKMDVLLEMNLAGEQTKHGFAEIELPQAIESARVLKYCRLRGFMIIPPFEEDAEKTRPYFRRLRELRDTYSPQHPDLLELSMGMSHDFEAAIGEGATMVRIGTALFGERL